MSSELIAKLEDLLIDMADRCGDHCSNNCQMCIVREKLRSILHPKTEWEPRNGAHTLEDYLDF